MHPDSRSCGEKVLSLNTVPCAVHPAVHRILRALAVPHAVRLMASPAVAERRAVLFGGSPLRVTLRIVLAGAACAAGMAEAAGVGSGVTRLSSSSSGAGSGFAGASVAVSAAGLAAGYEPGPVLDAAAARWAAGKVYSFWLSGGGLRRLARMFGGRARRRLSALRRRSMNIAAR